MAAKKVKKKGPGIKVIDGDEPIVAPKSKNAIVKPRGVDWGVRMKGDARVASNGRGDRVAEELARCVDVDSLVEFATEFLPAAEVKGYLSRAPNFGQFRMVIGNRIRGTISRAQREQSKKAKAAV
jgi:hypothetical protein